MKAKLFILCFALIFQAAVLHSARGSDTDPRVEKIVKNEILPTYFTQSGFKVEASEIKYDENEHFRDLEALQKRDSSSFKSVLWRLFELSISTNYARMQKQVNEKAHPEGKKLRAAMLDAFRQVGSIGPGGSAWSQTCMFIPAHVEWLIANPDQRSPGSAKELVKSNEELIRKLKAMLERLSVPESELTPDCLKERNTAFQKICEDMKRIESATSESEATAIRTDLARYF